MANNLDPKPMTSNPIREFSGEPLIPGDKSISHRSLILGSLAVGKSTINGLLESEDVFATIHALELLGAEFEKTESGNWNVYGIGTGGYSNPREVINCGNSGTSARLLMGAVSTTPISTVFTGDASLCSRPMGRVMQPLSEFGTEFIEGVPGLLPITVKGTDNPVPIQHQLTSNSAQVKSAILLAALNSPGETTVIGSALTRDHTERMLKSFGANIKVNKKGRKKRITLNGHAELKPKRITVPRDLSSAAFPIATALMVKDSYVRLPRVNINPTRAGFLTTIMEMGANLKLRNESVLSGEPVVDIEVSHCPLSGVVVPSERAPTMIDEYPILSALAAFAQGDTVMHGIGELRLKESDRIEAMARGLELCGIMTTETKDSLTIHGTGLLGVQGGAICESRLDHRIAMSFLCLGMGANEPVTIDDVEPIQTSFPNFVNMMNMLGGNIYH